MEWFALNADISILLHQMEQERGDCSSFFPHQGPHDGHGIQFGLWGTFLFHVGEGSAGEVNKISGDGLELEDQLKLIRQFFKNPQLKQLRLYCELAILPFDSSCALLIWKELMRELQDSTTLEYLEFAIGDDERLVRRPQHVCRKVYETRIICGIVSRLFEFVYMLTF